MLLKGQIPHNSVLDPSLSCFHFYWVLALISGLQSHCGLAVSKVKNVLNIIFVFLLWEEYSVSKQMEEKGAHWLSGFTPCLAPRTGKYPWHFYSKWKIISPNSCEVKSCSCAVSFIQLKKKKSWLELILPRKLEQTMKKSSKFWKRRR